MGAGLVSAHDWLFGQTFDELAPLVRADLPGAECVAAPPCGAGVRPGGAGKPFGGTNIGGAVGGDAGRVGRGRGGVGDRAGGETRAARPRRAAGASRSVLASSIPARFTQVKSSIDV